MPRHPRPRGSAPRSHATLLGLALAACLPLIIAAWPGSGSRAAAGLVVDSTSDGADSNPADGLCDDGAGRCTLRAAVEQANATTGADTITFNIGTGVKTITLASALPDVTGPLVVDATTQPGYAGAPLVEVTGQSGTAVAQAFRLTGGGSTVRGLAVGQFSGAGIVLAGAGGNRVEGCYIGLRSDGATRAAVGGGCVAVTDSPDNVIGGTSAGARNVLSGCGTGVDVSGAASMRNLIRGNYIGTDPAGTTAPFGNQNGVRFRAGASDNTVGGTAAGAGNVISGNRGDGVRADESTNNRVQGNLIGLAADGQSRLFNYLNGVDLISSTGHEVGGDTPAARNVISGNLSSGVHIAFGSGHTVRGNYIGTNAAGAAAVPNGEDGVSVRTSSNNLIGGDTAAARNLISGNTANGVEITPGAGVASDNVIRGNFIGTDASGTSALGNTFTGVQTGGTNTVVGGLSAAPGAAPGNLIAGQSLELFVGGSGTLVQGNLIGLDVTGANRFSHFNSTAVDCWGANAVIGGTQPGARNVISGHGTGIALANTGSAVIQGNYIGTDVSGTVAVGHTGAGVEVANTGVQQIGGTQPGAGNLISGNRTGVLLRAGTSTVEGNLIGTDASGASPLPNTHNGVFITFIARDSRIGGTAAGAANRIAFNGLNGIAVGHETFSPGEFSAGHALRGNSIHSNGRLGIDLVAAPDPVSNFTIESDGVTFNDELDADAGPNNLQNAPVVLSVNASGGTATVAGRLDAAANRTYTVDVYANASCDPTGHGEGQAHLGSTTATTDASGSATFSASLPAAGAPGQVYTATATDAAGNTSEFSVCHEAGAPGTVQFNSASFQGSEARRLVAVFVTRTLGTAGAASVDYATSDGTAAAGADYTPAQGTLHFAPGETTKSFIVTVLDDELDEEPETVLLSLSNPTGGSTLGAGATSTFNISDDDPLPRVTAADVAVAEGNAGTTELVFNVTLNAPSGRVVTLSYRTENLSANAPQDYQPASGSLVFNPGETVKQVSVHVNGDTEPEADEPFALRLSNVVNAAVPPGPGGPAFLRVFGTIWDDDSPGIRFSAPSYTVGEAEGAAVIRLVRRGDASAAASVAYAATGTRVASDGSGLASQRADFTPTFGRLDFAPGETEKSFAVPVNDDAYVEGPEAVTLSLAIPPQAPPGEFLSARLVITSDDTQPPTSANNPLDRTDFFVRQHYHDFLSREPDPAGLAFWTGEIEQCGADAQCREVRRISVSQAFFLSIEFQTTGYRVFRLYRATFPDSSFEHPGGMPQFLEFLRDTQQVARGVVVGQDGWQERLRQNVESFALQWVQRPEVLAQGPTGTPAQYVDRLFANSGVTPTAAERDAALAAFGAGGTQGRAAALLAVTDTASVYNRQYNPAFVYMQYVGYLRRAPNEEPDYTFSGFDFWLAKLDSFTLPGEDARDETVAVRRVQRAEMVKAFLSSAEYRRRFGQ